MDIKFAIITCSDTRDVTEDEAGAGLRGRGKLGALWVWDEAG